MAAATWTLTGSTSVKAVAASGTADAPTLVTQGMNLSNVGGFSVVVSADSGQTLSGAGTLLGYLYDDNVARWARCPDLDLTCGTSGVRDLGFPGFAVVSPRGRVAFVPSGVTISSGGVTIYINATKVSPWARDQIAI